MATLINNRSSLLTDPIRNFRFLVDFLPHDNDVVNMDQASFGFTSVSGLSVNTDSIPYREGGYNTTVHQIPGQTTFSPITLQRGVLINSDHSWEWMRNLFATAQGVSKNQIGGKFRCDLEISVLSHPIPGQQQGGNGTSEDDHVALRFKVFNAWPTSVAYSDMNAGDNGLMVEQMTLVHEGFDVNWASDVTLDSQAPLFS